MKQRRYSHNLSFWILARRLFVVTLTLLCVCDSVFAGGTDYQSGVSDDERSRIIQKLKTRHEKRQLVYYKRLLSVAYRLLDDSQSSGLGKIKVIPIVVDCSRPTSSTMPEVNVGQACLIKGVIPYGVRSDTGIEEGDVLLSVNGNSVSSKRDIAKALLGIKENRVMVQVSTSDGIYDEEISIVSYKKKYSFFVGGKANDVSAYTDGKSNIFVSVPMLKFADNDDELAFVLAHEIAHIERGHYLGKLLTSIVAAVPAALVQTAIGEDHRVAGMYAGQATYTLIKSPFSKLQELEADKVAYERLKERGFDSVMGAEVVRKFAVEMKNSNRKGIGGTHPASISRVTALQSY